MFSQFQDLVLDIQSLLSSTAESLNQLIETITQLIGL